MKIAFTPRVAYRMIERAKRIFCRYPSSTVSDEWKERLKQLRVFIVINPKLKSTAGTACFVRVRAARKLFKIPQEFKPNKVDGVPGYFIVEINPKYIILDPPKEVYDTVSHELAHCLDYSIRGWFGRTIPYHDEFWSFLHKRMGGDGESYLQTTKFKYQFKSAQKKAHEITQNFDPLDITEI